MAPSTRLRARPERRVNYYADTSDPEPESGSRTPPEPIASARTRGRKSTARQSAKDPSSHTPDASRKTVPEPIVRVKAGAVVKPKAKPKVRRKAPTPKKDERPTKQECSICATEKATARSFKVSDDACEHLQSICSQCIAKMLKTKVAERQLKEADMSCPMPKCDHLLDYPALQAVVTKAAFTDYDKAVTNYALSGGESYMACLSAKCGLYFSIEDCKSAKRSGQMIACPYCDYEICFECNRPWTSHKEGGCDQTKKAEDELSEEAVKIMGAKPCPNCGINIEKRGGCDHIRCEQCNHNFCWVCLVQYTGGTQHLNGCPNARVRLAVDPANWLPDDLNLAQINNLIAQADARLSNIGHTPVPAPAQVPQFPLALPGLAVAFGGAFNAFNPFNRINTVGGGGARVELGRGEGANANEVVGRRNEPARARGHFRRNA